MSQHLALRAPIANRIEVLGRAVEQKASSWRIYFEFRRCPIQSSKPHANLDLQEYRAPGQPRWILVSIYASSGFFMFVLLIAALFSPPLRLIHACQALVYIAVIVLARRGNAWGFGAGCLIAGFWNFIFLRGEAPYIWAFMTGKVMRPDVGLQLAATVAHFVLIVACLAGFLR